MWNILFFQYYTYLHPNGLSSNTSPISSPQDPTRGKLNNAIYFLFKPMNWVGYNTLMMIEAGMQRLRFDLVKGEGKSLTNINPRVSLLSKFIFYNFFLLLRTKFDIDTSRTTSCSSSEHETREPNSDRSTHNLQICTNENSLPHEKVSYSLSLL